MLHICNFVCGRVDSAPHLQMEVLHLEELMLPPLPLTRFICSVQTAQMVQHR